MGLGGVRVPQGPVASGMGQAAWLHPQSFNLGCAPGGAGAIPGVTARSPSPVCALSNAAVGCSDAGMGLGGGHNTLQPPFPRTSPAAILAGKCRLRPGRSRGWERSRSLFQEAGTGEHRANYGG